MDSSLHFRVILAVSRVVRNQKIEKSSGMFIPAAFQHPHALTYAEFLQIGQRNNNEYYIAFLARRREIYSFTKTMRHKESQILAQYHDLYFELLPCPLCFSNLHPFGDFKKMFTGKGYGFNEEMIVETEMYLNDFWTNRCKRKPQKSQRTIRMNVFLLKAYLNE